MGYASRIQEVHGLQLDTVPRVPRLETVRLSGFVPMIYHGSKRQKKLKTHAIVIPWDKLFRTTSEKLRFGNRDELFDAMRIADGTKLIISAVDLDAKIEPFWSQRHKGRLIEQLKKLDPDLFTCPNYSLPFGVPRQDNLHNLKRIVLGWSELVEAGINTALHLNARTDRDWERLTAFVADREEVTSVSFEFGTGAKRVRRGEWHVEKLVHLGRTTKRDLQLIIRGGFSHIPALRSAYQDIVSIDTTSFMKSIRARRKLFWYPTIKPEWIKQPYDTPLDDLLQENVEVYRRMMAFQTIPSSSFRTKAASVGQASFA